MSRVYISHTVQDAATAEAIRAALSRARIDCALASRDKTRNPLADAARPDGPASLEPSDVLLIVHSAAADYDADMIRDARQALAHGAMITAVRSEPLDFSGPLAEAVGQPPSIDLFPPITLRLPQVVQSIQMLLAEIQRRVPEAAVSAPQPSANVSAPADRVRSEPAAVEQLSASAGLRDASPAGPIGAMPVQPPPVLPLEQAPQPSAGMSEARASAADLAATPGNTTIATPFPSAFPTAQAQPSRMASANNAPPPVAKGSSSGRWVAVLAAVLLIVAVLAGAALFAGQQIYRRFVRLRTDLSGATAVALAKTDKADLTPAHHANDKPVAATLPIRTTDPGTTSNASAAQTRPVDLKSVLGGPADATGTRSGNDIDTPQAGSNDAAAGGNVPGDLSGGGGDPMDLLQRHDFTGFDKLLASGQVNVNQPLRNHDYPLGYAIKQGLQKQAIAIIDHDANLDLIGDDGKTFLYIAAEHGCADVIKAICAKGVPVDQPLAVDGRAPLYAAVAQRQDAAVKALLSLGADPDRSSKIKGETPRSIASKSGYTDAAIRAMLESPATRAGG
jgi:hypothetical protein